MQYVKVKSINPVNTETVYHLTVKNNHNFFGNNLCLHNCDYYNNAGNEGECFVKFHNQGDKQLVIKQGEAMAQFMFQKYLLADGDSTDMGEDRNGGFGSTTK
jgi:dUTP pyrophosphatase